MRSYYVYVPAASNDNLAIGVERQTWGWRSSALDKRDFRAIAESMQVGDQLILGHRGPNSRVKSGGWTNATLRHAVFTTIVTPLYASTAPVWPDGIYPERIDLDVSGSEEPVAGHILGADAMEALRWSANTGGVPVPATPINPAILEAEQLPVDPLVDSESDELLGMPANLNATARTTVRREQRRLRWEKFGAAAQIRCDLCGRCLPRRLVAAAHIKRRADATPQERRRLSNIMGACVLGCDGLFEYGYVHVDDTGILRTSPMAGLAGGDLLEAAKALDGRACTAWGTLSAEFFTHHRAAIAKV